MLPSDLVGKIDEAAAALGIDYFVWGSVASSYYGEYRSTRDVDVATMLSSRDAESLCAAFPAPEWYVSPEAAVAAAASHGMFNLIHVPTGLKIDVSALGDTPKNGLWMRRRRRIDLTESVTAWLASPEDVILSKLEFYRLGSAEKHVRDITSIARISHPPLDMAYLDHWALRIGVGDEWRAVKQRLGAS